ncbi:major capsid protein [Nonomuraea sp. NPDC050556]|uniref:major capsid protein n=1 Tax=Nonomuraea sp. NPDC050556 TaxID=3364369 RepID=UPI0037AF8C81
MNDTISKLLAAWTAEHADEAARDAAVQAVIAEHANLEELRDAVVAHFDAVHGKDAYADEDMAAMAALVKAADLVEDSLTRAAEREAQIGGFADKIAGLKERTAQEAAEATETAEDIPAAPEREQGAQESVEDVAADKEPEPVAASGKPAPKVPLGGRHDKPASSALTRATFSTTAASDVPEYGAGQVLAGIGDLATAATNRLQALARGGVHGSSRVGIATIHRESPNTLDTFDGSDVNTMVEKVTKESGLPGGNLIAAGGWCAPSETLYDMCPVADGDAGMWDVPEIVAKRGGIRFPNVPDFSDIYSAVGFHLTETQVAAGTKKSCYEIPCTDYSECRMDVDGLCIKSPILTERAWPELITYFTQQALAAHKHKLNAYKLATAAAAATAVVVTAGASPDKNTYGPGATAGVLGLVELQVEYYRYKYRMAQNASLEAVFPHWVLGILRSDLAKRNGVDMINVSNAQLISYLSARGVRPQFVYDWQDALATGTDTDFGGATNPKAWPATVDVLLYPAGTYFQLTAPVITIDGLYDSTLLETNMHLALFTEEGVAVCKRCYQATKLTIPLCPDGTTGAQTQITCPAA